MSTKPEPRTVKQELKFYFKAMVSYSILLFAVLMFVLWVYVRSYDSMTERTSALEHLYGSLAEMTDSMYQYGISREKEGLAAYEEAGRSALKSLDILDSAAIAGNYRRNLIDLKILFQKLQSEQQKLTQVFEGNAADDEKQRNYYQIYSQFQQIALSMERKENTLRHMITADANQTKSKMEGVIQKLLVLTIAAVLVFALLFWNLTEWKGENITKPIEILTREAERIKTGGLEDFVMEEYDLQEYHLLETDTLSEGFQTMLRQIERQIQELHENARIREQLHQQEIENLQVKKQLEEQEIETLRVKNLLTVSELRGLQMHMNPHFLFNTLNMIRQNAYLGKTEKTVYLLEETAALLRYNLSYNGKLVSLQQELEGLEHYICLQEERFEDRLSFTFQLDERFHQIKVPCFILQPLIENSIRHGVSDLSRTLNITVRTRYLEEEGQGEICVEDDGKGMDAQRLAWLKEDMKRDNWEDKKHIGMSNVYKRLMLLSNGTMSFDVFSEPGQGTKVQIRIPYSGEGQE